jgi:ribulose-5-phosphate 4-epimerase/fuculose-1-phosphate aldolase
VDIHRGMAAALARCPEDIPDEEWELRVELAAFYRVVHFFGWSDLIYNHITVRVPGEEVAFLINPYGLLYEEVTAFNLVKINAAGEKLARSDYGVNPAGFVIHSAVHSARPDAHCIIHTHTKDGMAVAGKEDGLRFDNFYSSGFYGRVSYHDFQGVTTDDSEKDSIVASLGPTNDVLILRNHGLLVVGPHVPSTFSTMYGLQRACEIQVRTHSHGGRSIAVPHEVLTANPARRARMLANQTRHGEFPFAAAVRRAIGSYEAVV